MVPALSPPIHLHSSMAATRLALLCIVAIFLISVRADVSIEGALDATGLDDPIVSSLRAEMEHLKSRFHSLESLLDEKTKELDGKDRDIADRDITIRDKSFNIASLQTEIATLQNKGKIDVQEKMGKAHARAGELENQVDILKSDIEKQRALISGLKENLNVANDEIVRLNNKITDLQKVNDEVNVRVRKTERALFIAEEEMKKTMFDVTSKTNELIEVRNAWIPHWLAYRLSSLESLLKDEWIEHGKPALDIIIHEISEKKALAEKWAEPYIYVLKNKHIPALKEKWLLAIEYVEPHVKIIYAKVTEIFETCRSALSPHVIKLQKLIVPYIREAKRIGQPTVDRVATVVKPCANTVRVKLRPYTTKAVLVYGEILKSVEAYHSQVQCSVYEVFGKHDVTKSFATDDFVWFLASTLLIFPVLTLLRILYAVIPKKRKLSTRNNNTGHGRRKVRRLNPEKEKEIRSR